MDRFKEESPGPDYYPTHTTSRLIELIGYTMTISLSTSFGGRQILVPITTHETHPIALTIGPIKAEKLSREFGGLTLDVPSETSIIRQRRDKFITEKYHSSPDVSIAKLASEIINKTTDMVK